MINNFDTKIQIINNANMNNQPIIVIQQKIA